VVTLYKGGNLAVWQGEVVADRRKIPEGWGATEQVSRWCWRHARARPRLSLSAYCVSGSSLITGQMSTSIAGTGAGGIKAAPTLRQAGAG